MIAYNYSKMYWQISQWEMYHLVKHEVLLAQSLMQTAIFLSNDTQSIIQGKQNEHLLDHDIIIRLALVFSCQ